MSTATHVRHGAYPWKLLAGRVGLLFLFGAIVLSTMDGFHTHGGATSYPHPVFLRMAWWTPLLFGSVAAFGGLAFTGLHAKLEAPGRRHSAAELTIAIVLFGALYFASGFLRVSNAAITAVLLAGGAALWAWLDRSWQGVVLAIGTALAGCTTEVVLTSVGAFSHLRADLLGIPMWLPALYIASTPVIGHFARSVLASARA